MSWPNPFRWEMRIGMYAHGESNPNLKNRNLPFYSLNYGRFTNASAKVLFFGIREIRTCSKMINFADDVTMFEFQPNYIAI